MWLMNRVVRMLDIVSRVYLDVLVVVIEHKMKISRI